MTEKKGNTVQVLYTFFDQRLSEQAWERHLCKLPKETQASILRYRRWEDRQAGVFGKLLLIEGFKGLGYTPNAISWISSDGHGRPLVDLLVDPSTAPKLRQEKWGSNSLSVSTLSMHRAEAGCGRRVDFNISHSGEYVVCAVSEGKRVGIDIEKRKAFRFMDLADCFSAEEWEEMAKSGNREAAFYDFWTMKESVLKADGRGLSMPMGWIHIKGGRTSLEGATWFLKELDFGPHYSCHLATNAECSSIEMRKVEFDQEPDSCRVSRLGHRMDCLSAI